MRTKFVFGKLLVLGFSAGMVAAADAQDTSTPAPVAEVQSDGEIEEIIVTAQHREQRMQDVPIAVSALTAQSLGDAGITGTANLQQSIPSLSINMEAVQAEPFLRGIGSQIGSANAESSVAIYLDGVYMPAAFGNFFNFNNIERVEVLKGPQGTLFGRNSTGGVIQVITRDPSYKPEAELSAGYANYQTFSTSAYLAAPVTDKLGVSFATMYSDQRNGWGTDLATNSKTPGDRELGTRAKLVYKPADSTTIHFGVDYVRSDNGGINGQQAPGTTNLAGQGYPGNFNTYNDPQDTDSTKSIGSSLKIDQDFGKLRLTSISAFRDIKSQFVYDQDLSSAPIVLVGLSQYGRMWSQELHLQSESAATFQWLLGAYYFHYNTGQNPFDISGLSLGALGFPFPVQAIDYTTASHAESKSLFAQGTYPIPGVANTNLTLGIRETWDKARADASSAINGSSSLGDAVFGAPTHPSQSYSKPSWRVILDHKFTADVLGYVSYNRGTKSGAINTASAPATDTPYLPEQLDAYEAGLKSELFEHRVRLNAAAYYYDIKNLQFEKVTNGAGYIYNAPSATNYGGELELEARATKKLSVNANVGLIHSKFGDFPGAPNTERLPSGLDSASGDPNFNAEGNQLPYAPKVTGSIGYKYTVPANGIGTFIQASNLYYYGGTPSEIDNRLKIDKYTLLNASLEWRSLSDKFGATLWGRNLTNEYYYVQLIGQAGGSDLGTPSAPRTYGVTFNYTFQ